MSFHKIAPVKKARKTTPAPAPKPAAKKKEAPKPAQKRRPISHKN